MYFCIHNVSMHNCAVIVLRCMYIYTLCMTHASEPLNNQNVSYNKFKMCSNKTVLPHAWGKTAPRLFTLILGFTVVMI